VFDPDAVSRLPDVVLRQGEIPPGRRPRLVATGYGGSVRTSFSGSSFYLSSAGIDSGSLDGAFTLFSDQRPDRALQAKGAWWKLQRALRRESVSGFKFSGEFSAHLWRRHLPALAGTDIISNFQLYSERFFRQRTAYGVRAFYYLDGTLHDYLRGYREYDVQAIDPSTLDRVIELERQGYHHADGVAVMSEFVARTLVEEYGLARDRITVVPPGANLTDETAERIVAARHARAEAEEFTVGFVGVYPERKGLPKLAAAVAALRRDNVPVRLQVVGRCPEDIASMDGVDALGFISKATEPTRFAEAMARVDLGCQLSTVEMFGIAVVEFLRCGIPVLATDVGGVSDTLSGGGCIDVAADVTTDEVGAAIRRVVDDRAERQRLSVEAADRRDTMRWQRTATALGELVAGHGTVVDHHHLPHG